MCRELSLHEILSIQSATYSKPSEMPIMKAMETIFAKHTRSLRALGVVGVLLALSITVVASHAPYPLTNTAATPDTLDLSRIYGRIQYVEHFPDYKVQVVDNFPDLRVQVVEHFPDGPGKWQIVEHFPDYQIQIVEHSPDFKIQYVDHFPGVE